MKKILLLIVFLLLLPFAFAETEIEFSDDFEVDGDDVRLAESNMEFKISEMQKNIEENLDLPEEIEVRRVYVFMINDSPHIKVDLTAHIKFLFFKLSPEASVTINLKENEINDIELPWYAGFLENRILKIIQEQKESISVTSEG